MDRKIDILLVEDNPSDVLLTQEALSTSRVHIQSCERLSEALKWLRSANFNAILLDLGLPDSQGLDTLCTLRSKNPEIAIVVLTGRDDEKIALQALKVGAQDYLVKGDLKGGWLNRAIRYAVERSETEGQLRQSEQRFRELTANIDQVLWMIDARESKVLYVSAGYEKLWGRSCQSLIDNPHSYMDGVHPLDIEYARLQDVTMYQTGHVDAEFRVLRPDGSIRFAWIRSYPVKENGQLVRLVGVIEDVTEERHLAQERDALLSRLQLHIERLPLAYMLYDTDLRIVDWNPCAERIFGFSKDEVVGMGPPYEKLVPRAFWKKGDELLDRLRQGDMEAHSINENLTKDGRGIICQWFNTPLMEVDGRFMGFLCLARDVTEQKSLESQLHQAQKMEAIGLLAGGIAHDFNNLLTVIAGYSDLLLDSAPPGDPSREALEAIKEAGQRSADLTRQLLAFSRKQIMTVKVINLNEVVLGTEKMLHRIIGEDIDMATALQPQLANVLADPGQIEQILLNLAVNARDAMPKGGKLTIETKNVELDGNYAETHPWVRPGQFVMLAVSDTGGGMTEEVKRRVFEPFFTTKGPREGTGLGLAVVHGIVKQSKGSIELYTEPGAGSTFKLYFPQSDTSVTTAKHVTDDHALPKGSETILLVEDEAGVRDLARKILDSCGYKVFDANGGADAFRVCAEYRDPIHLLITDVVMPNEGGRVVAERLRTIHPEMKVLFVSGYTDDAVVRHGILQAQVNFLQKPFTRAALAAKVREVLSQ